MLGVLSLTDARRGLGTHVAFRMEMGAVGPDAVRAIFEAAWNLTLNPVVDGIVATWGARRSRFDAAESSEEGEALKFVLSIGVEIRLQTEKNDQEWEEGRMV